MATGLGAEGLERVLQHYGVRGMKWGKRKSGSSVSASPEHTRARELSKKPIKSLSNTELKDLTQRLQLEKQYSELSSNAKTTTRGHKAIKSILATAGTINQAYTFLNSPLGKEIRSRLG